MNSYRFFFITISFNKYLHVPTIPTQNRPNTILFCESKACERHTDWHIKQLIHHNTITEQNHIHKSCKMIKREIKRGSFCENVIDIFFVIYFLFIMLMLVLEKKLIFKYGLRTILWWCESLWGNMISSCFYS